MTKRPICVRHRSRSESDFDGGLHYDDMPAFRFPCGLVSVPRFHLVDTVGHGSRSFRCVYFGEDGTGLLHFGQEVVAHIVV